MVRKGTVPENLNQRGVEVIAAACSKTSPSLYITVAPRLENPTTVPLSNWDTKNLRKLWEKKIIKGRHACCL